MDEKSIMDAMEIVEGARVAVYGQTRRAWLFLLDVYDYLKERRDEIQDPVVDAIFADPEAL